MIFSLDPLPPAVKEKYIQIYTFTLYIDAYSHKISYAMLFIQVNLVNSGKRPLRKEPKK
jgi:hypothetical protein